jgi:hypothetical protein
MTSMIAGLGRFVVPPVPERLDDQQEWHRLIADAYLRGEVDEVEMAKVRVIFRDQRDTFRVASELDKARAALTQARANMRIAEALESIDYGADNVTRLKVLLAKATGQKRLAEAAS